MEITIIKADLKAIEPLRILFLKERNFQFVYNKCHQYGWADPFLYLTDNIPVGYGANMEGKKKGVRDNVFEFYVRPAYRKYIDSIFQKHCSTTNARYIECQSNDVLLSQMLFEHSHNTNAEAILFEDKTQTDFNISGSSLHRIRREPDNDTYDCQYILKLNDNQVASGGFMLNYNMPYADIYYEVNENFRRMGLGSYFIQELKKEAYLIGRMPAARCNIKNKASKASLIKAGFSVCGYMLFGELNEKGGFPLVT